MLEKPNHLKLVPDDDSVPVIVPPPATLFFEDSARRNHRVNISRGNVEINGTMVRLDMFLDMVKHVLTATNVPENDPRHAFVVYVQELTLAPGYGDEGQRFVPEDE